MIEKKVIADLRDWHDCTKEGMEGKEVFGEFNRFSQGYLACLHNLDLKLRSLECVCTFSHRTWSATAALSATPRGMRISKMIKDKPVVSLEVMAEAEHESWSGWMKYLDPKMIAAFKKDLLSYGMLESDVAVVVEIFETCGPVERYHRQMNTPYADLSEKEKESDRIEARKKLKAYGVAAFFLVDVSLVDSSPFA